MATHRATQSGTSRPGPAADAPGYDVIVLGAGLAGLTATRELTRAGYRVALVEARARFGGRLWTQHSPRLDHPIEMGPEWFDQGGTVDRLLTRAASATVEGDGRHWRRVGAELRGIEEMADGGAEMHRRLAELAGPDRPLSIALEEVIDDGSRQAAAMLRHYVEGFHAADPDQLSLEWFRTVETNQPAGVSELRSQHGLDVAVDTMLRDITSAATVFLGTVATEVHWAEGHVAVTCRARDVVGVLRAPRVVVTLPLAVLTAPAGAEGAVRFDPPLAAKQPAFDRLATGSVLKIGLVFDRPFWFELPELDELLFLQDFSQPIPTWWSTLPEHAPLLVGWAAGPQVARLGALDPPALRATAVRSLAHALQVVPSVVDERLRQVHCHDWQADPYARGGYSWVRTDGLDAHRLLAAPLDSTLFFAGEATCGDGYNATMDGAIASGERVSREIFALR